jgi:sugar lactone lactonase YvrE
VLAAGLAYAATGGATSTYAASGTLYGLNVTGPGGGALVDGHFWVSDHSGAFCRMDAGAPGSSLAPNGEAVCYIGATPSTTKDRPPQDGQPSWDTVANLVYVPDYKSNSRGVWRFTYSPLTQQIVDTGTIIAPSAGLGGLRPDATALGPDGNLYVGSLNTGDIKRVTNPGGDPTTQVVQTIGKSVRGKRVFGLAFVGNDLYVAETNGFTVIRNATSPGCTGGCQAVNVPGAGVGETDAVATDGVDTLYFAQAGTVYRYTISTGAVVAYGNAGTLTPDQAAAVAQNPGFFAWAMNCTGQTCPFDFPPGEPSGLTLDAQGNLYVGDDPGIASGLNVRGRIWEIPAGAPPLG